MLEQLDPTKKLKHKEWEALYPALERRLRQLQGGGRRAGLPAIVLFEGWDGAGKSACIKALTQPFDPRGFTIWPIRSPRSPETNYPWLWRFWMKLPARGQIVIFDRSWYRRALAERVEGAISNEEARRALRDIADLEQMLTADGYVILKFWLHISQDEQRRRLKFQEKHAPTGRQIRGWNQNRKYEEYLLAAEEMIGRTDAKWAPWTVVEATDPLYASWKVCDRATEVIVESLRARGIDPDTLDETEDGAGDALPALCAGPGENSSAS